MTKYEWEKLHLESCIKVMHETTDKEEMQLLSELADGIKKRLETMTVEEAEQSA